MMHVVVNKQLTTLLTSPIACLLYMGSAIILKLHGGGSGLRLNNGFDVKLEIVGLSLMIVFGWTLRGLTNGFL